MGGFAGTTQSRAKARATLARMAAARTCRDRPRRELDGAAAFAFGARDADVAVGPDGETLALSGYARIDDEHLDAAALLERWRRRGEALLGDLRGEFALAVRTRDRAFFARDPLGARPLYVGTLRGGDVAFATAIEPLLAAGAGGALDASAIVESLLLGYPVAPRTALAGVRQLGPGEAWTWRDGELAQKSYFRPRERLAPRSLAAAAREVDAAFTRAVSRSVPARGRVGAFLSGGIDSSIVLARLHELGVPVEAFTLHFGDERAGEIRYAHAVAKHLGVRHNVLDIDAKGFVDSIVDVARHLEDVVSEAIAIPNFMLARAASKRMDVLFTGEGGDQSFGGPKNVKLALAHAYADHPHAPSLASSYFASYHYLWDDLDAALAPDVRRSFDEASLVARTVEPFFGARAPRSTFVGRAMIGNTVVKGGNNILVKAAKIIGAAHDVAVRSPMFDADLVELAFTLSPTQKQFGYDEKLVLKKASERSLPASVVWRPKRGMSLPLPAWFEDELGTFARDVLTEKAIRERGVFRWPYVEKLLRREPLPTDYGRPKSAAKLWLVLMTEIHLRLLDEMRRDRAEAA